MTDSVALFGNTLTTCPAKLSAVCRLPVHLDKARGWLHPWASRGVSGDTGRVIGHSEIRGEKVVEKTQPGESHYHQHVLDRVECVTVAFDCSVRMSGYKQSESSSVKCKSVAAAGCRPAGQKEACGLTDRQTERLRITKRRRYHTDCHLRARTFQQQQQPNINWTSTSKCSNADWVLLSSVP